MRQGGHSAGPFASLNLGAHVDDEADAVASNRRLFVAQCNLPAEPAWIRQVHGTTVVTDPPPDTYPEADAIVSQKSRTVCAVLTADCLPVVFASDDGSEIAAAHAGWRGLLDGVLEATIARMQSPASEMLAWMGPAISQPAFEVGEEVRERFVAIDEVAAEYFEVNANGRWQADLYGLARARLRRAGVPRVYGGGLCTFADANSFFSYRRDGRCGRMATFVFRNYA